MVDTIIEMNVVERANRSCFVKLRLIFETTYDFEKPHAPGITSSRTGLPSARLFAGCSPLARVAEPAKYQYSRMFFYFIKLFSNKSRNLASPILALTNL